MLDDQVKSPSYDEISVIQSETTVRYASLKCEQVGRGMYRVSPSLLANLNPVRRRRSQRKMKTCRLNMRKHYPWFMQIHEGLMWMQNLFAMVFQFGNVARRRWFALLLLKKNHLENVYHA